MPKARSSHAKRANTEGTSSLTLVLPCNIATMLQAEADENLDSLPCWVRKLLIRYCRAKEEELMAEKWIQKAEELNG